MEKYVYCEPMGGWNDVMVNIKIALMFCKRHRRRLLVNGEKTVYRINFANYFVLQDHNVLFDTNEIKTICSNPNHTIYPNELQDRMKDILDGTIRYPYANNIGISCNLPKVNPPETILVYAKCGGGLGCIMFRELRFLPKIRDICEKRYNRLQRPYACIHIRNTDYKCDYRSYFAEHEQEIRSFQTIYVATDDKKALEFYKERGLPVQNFSTFPETDEFENLHTSNLDPECKFQDLLADIYIATMSDNLFSNSRGGFIGLLRIIHWNKAKFLEQFL